MLIILVKENDAGCLTCLMQAEYVRLHSPSRSHRITVTFLYFTQLTSSPTFRSIYYIIYQFFVIISV